MSPPAPPPYAPPPRGHALELILGALIGAVVLVISLVASVAFSDYESGWFVVTIFAGPILALVAFVVLAVVPRTRYWGLGLLIGFFLTLIVGGGSCVALIVGLN